MKSIKEIEQKIDLMIIERFATVGDLDKILKNPDDSNETKIEKALATIDKLKTFDKKLITNNIIYSGKDNDIIDEFKLKILCKIMKTFKIEELSK